jgi:DNA-binding response OmpR family regulator
VSEPTRVLIVEDRPEDRELIEHELANAKIRFESLNVTTREDFLQALRSFKPDIVLSDFSLPEFDALEAIGILRRYESAVPLILVTGAQSEEIAVECMKRGADDYIMKSTLKRLPSAVLNALKNRAARTTDRPNRGKPAGAGTAIPDHRRTHPGFDLHFGRPGAIHLRQPVFPAKPGLRSRRLGGDERPSR